MRSVWKILPSEVRDDNEGPKQGSDSGEVEAKIGKNQNLQLSGFSIELQIQGKVK